MANHQAQAQPTPAAGQVQQEVSTVDRTVLPAADPPFRGRIEVAFKDSKADFPEPLGAPKGTAVCAASRASLLTGRNGHSVGMGGVPESSTGFPGYNAIIPRGAATVLEILRQNGYGTAWVGKTHVTSIHEITAAGPFDRWPRGMGAEYLYGFFGRRREPMESAAVGEHHTVAGAENAGRQLSLGG